MARNRENHFVVWSDHTLTVITREITEKNGKAELSNYGPETHSYTAEECKELKAALDDKERRERG